MLVTVYKDIIDAPKDKLKAKGERIKRQYEGIKRVKEDNKNLISQLIDLEKLKDKNGLAIFL